MADYEGLVNLVQKGEIEPVQTTVQELLDQGNSPQDIIAKGITASLDIVGQKFSAGECFIPEMLVAARASKKALEILKPLVVKADTESKGRVVIGTVKGDLHDIGKNIVAMMLESAGFEIMDLGIDVSPEQFTAAIRDFKPHLVGMSCLLTTTMGPMRTTVEKIKEANLRDQVKILIGGPPTSEEFAKEIGADFYGKDAYRGVQIAREAVEGHGF